MDKLLIQRVPEGGLLLSDVLMLSKAQMRRIEPYFPYFRWAGGCAQSAQSALYWRQYRQAVGQGLAHLSITRLGALCFDANMAGMDEGAGNEVLVQMK